VIPLILRYNYSKPCKKQYSLQTKPMYASKVPGNDSDPVIKHLALFMQREMSIAQGVNSPDYHINPDCATCCDGCVTWEVMNNNDAGSYCDMCGHFCSAIAPGSAAQGKAPQRVDTLTTRVVTQLQEQEQEQEQKQKEQSPLCKARGCRHAHAHITVDHQCGKCKGWGHGQMECATVDSPKVLSKTLSKALPNAVPNAVPKVCKAEGCKFPDTHVTSGHKCGNCGEFCHGLLECGDQLKLNELAPFLYDVVQTPCTVKGCIQSHSHTTQGHKCRQCHKHGHGRETCPF
jgi:hypothetical protein